ncbi:MAG TPA: TolC family protein [Verrucomicrobiae bacterium]|jgi:outer membrane protein TolC|nr:TolC family protein [Verrucomicrobiae bacterium]
MNFFRLGYFAILLFAFACMGDTMAARAESDASPSDSTEAHSSEMIKGVHAPASSTQQWQPPDLRGLVAQIKSKPQLEAEAGKEYSLVELVDFAERANPETKVAWEEARQAAAAVGLVQSEYFPLLAVKASALYAREPVPVPLTATEAGFLDVKDQYVEPVLSLEWLLLDFGRRKSAVTGAKFRLLAADLGFNARHQQIVFGVQTAFYELAKAKGKIVVAHSSLDAAVKVKEAVEARSKSGLATSPEVSQAEQQAAQAAFDLEEVIAKERDAQVALAQIIGVTPTIPLQVEDFSRLPLPNNLADTVEQVIDRSLEQRPDLLAQAAIIRQREAEVKNAQEAYYPTLSFLGQAGGTFDRAEVNVEGTRLPWVSTEQPIWAVGLALNWNLFDGGARKKKLELARASRDAALRSLEDSRDKAISQVFQFYTDTRLAVRRLDVAGTLVEASQKSYSQTFESYNNGLSSLVDLLNARQGLSQAEYTLLETRAALLESTSALAFASGDLGPDFAGKVKSKSEKP